MAHKQNLGKYSKPASISQSIWNIFLIFCANAKNYSLRLFN